MTDAQRRALALAMATAIAIPAEGLRRIAYYDPPGILTVCYGHTGNVQNRRYTMAECQSLLTTDMAIALNYVERCAPGLPENVLAAFADAVYNTGPKVACDTQHSTAARLLSQRRIAEACNELPKWDKARVAGQLVALPGLTKRRLEERDLCLAPSADPASTP